MKREGSLNIFVAGIVQGVGFRPFIYSLAHEMGVKGFVTNTSEGVAITAEGGDLEGFVERIRTEAPPLSKITAIEISPCGAEGFSDFSIRESRETGNFTLLSPDISICPDCLEELFDRKDRRYLYPFINCTGCGPRYSITKSVPYDRTNTTMDRFKMCTECSHEYHDPRSRRFHAQPDACGLCGPRVRLTGKDATDLEGEDPVREAIRLLQKGAVIGIKGLGGFHIACDATNAEAVARLRERKRRSNKPFALMAPDIERIEKFCYLSGEEKDVLHAKERPVVLLRRRRMTTLPREVSPNNRYLGFMLPYTPLHYLLFYCPSDKERESEKMSEAPPLARPHFDALIMTSGNMAEEPIVTDNEEALARLSDIADAFLVHDRDIFMRVDDSVVRVREGRSGGAIGKEAGRQDGQWFSERDCSSAAAVSFVRRSRGYVPRPIQLKDDGPDVLGCGADLKNTFTITKGRYAIPGQHIGDMENYETLRFYEETLRNIKSVYRAEPVALAHDSHPGYLSTRWALGQEGIAKYAIQHHYAHITSVMAERGIEEKVIGVAFDGTGYGDDGALWGGEFLVADIKGFTRAGHISYVPLPGGETAIREPWRTCLSYLKRSAGGDVWDYLRDSGFIERYGKGQIENVLKVCDLNSFSPLSSGAGRLFDAVSALIGACDKNTFEGEAAMALEALVHEEVDVDYPVDVSFKDPMEVDFSMTFLGILDDLKRGEDKGVISAKFHNTVASAVVSVVLKLSAVHNIRKVVLSGGVFQNVCLLRRVMDCLLSECLDIYINELVPCNDGGISLGQAYIARERLKAGIRK